MKFHLNYTPKSSEFKIDHQHKIMLIGSCFAENIGGLLYTNGFKTYVNPSGILFNPRSISSTLINCILNKKIDENSIIERNGLFFSYLHHSSIYDTDKKELLKKLNDIQKKTTSFLKQADYLVITFGTAYAYTKVDTGELVANCHKQPTDSFEKKLLSAEDIVNDFFALKLYLHNFNPKLKLIFTVSPVKYLKDGVEENSLSKATLILAINALKKNPISDYFPAYELVNDDLRDYRFYKQDMAHPNEEAINYVWDKFANTYFTSETIQLNKELYSIHQSEKHKLLFPESEEALKFKSDLEKKKKD